MPDKLQLYSQLARETAVQIIGSRESWTAFLRTAARLYKYPYHDQLMIYAQQPDAAACAEYSFWNNRWGRYVRKGSHGIALIDTSGDYPRLRYVFDVSDTGTRADSREVRLWELREEHRDSVSAMLERDFEVSGGTGLASQLEAAAKAADRREQPSAGSVSQLQTCQHYIQAEAERRRHQSRTGRLRTFAGQNGHRCVLSHSG